MNWFVVEYLLMGLFCSFKITLNVSLLNGREPYAYTSSFELLPVIDFSTENVEESLIELPSYLH